MRLAMRQLAVRSSVKAVSETTDAAKSAVAWTGARVLSFADDLDPGQHRRFIEIGELAVSAYRASPELPKGCRPLSKDEHWMHDWVVDVHQGGGGIPQQYVYGSEVLSSVRKTFPDKELVVTGHSLGGGIAAYSTIQLGDPGRLVCATYNAAVARFVEQFVESAFRRVLAFNADLRGEFGGDAHSAQPHGLYAILLEKLKRDENLGDVLALASF